MFLFTQFDGISSPALRMSLRYSSYALQRGADSFIRESKREKKKQKVKIIVCLCKEHFSFVSDNKSGGGVSCWNWTRAFVHIDRVYESSLDKFLAEQVCANGA